MEKCILFLTSSFRIVFLCTTFNPLEYSPPPTSIPCLKAQGNTAYKQAFESQSESDSSLSNNWNGSILRDTFIDHFLFGQQENLSFVKGGPLQAGVTQL